MQEGLTSRGVHGATRWPVDTGRRKKPFDKARRDRVAAWLRYYKNLHDWTNQQLADALGFTEPHVTNILNRKAGHDFGPEFIFAMHDRLHIRWDELLERDPEGIDPQGKPTAPQVSEPAGRAGQRRRTSST